MISEMRVLEFIGDSPQVEGVIELSSKTGINVDVFFERLVRIAGEELFSRIAAYCLEHGGAYMEILGDILLGHGMIKAAAECYREARREEGLSDMSSLEVIQHVKGYVPVDAILLSSRMERSRLLGLINKIDGIEILGNHVHGPKIKELERKLIFHVPEDAESFLSRIRRHTQKCWFC